APFYRENRPADHPLIAHVHPSLPLAPWADATSVHAQKLIKAFWPGPLTLVLPIGPCMPLAVSGGQHSVGVRCPSHPACPRRCWRH
ncbi:MAG: translation factor Sua5, partial [Limnobacter sp.]|nr:translation factor Sua5 [Limnobacter sp.]